MKKLVTLVLALVLTLTAVSAFGAASPTNVTNSKTTGTTYSAPEILNTPLADNETTKALKALFADALAAGNILTALPEDVQAKIPADYATVNEMGTWQLTGSVSGIAYLTVNYVLPTKYTAGEKIMVVYIIPKGADFEYVVLEGTVQANGSVSVVMNADALAKLAGKEATVVFISKK